MKIFAVMFVCVVVVALAGCTPPSETFSAVAGPNGPANLVVEQLRAGPVTMKFDNGELRYIESGDGKGRNVENVRRVYFAVRDQRFDTPTPTFDKITVVRHADSFTADLTARVRHGHVEFAWTGRIEGQRDGTITYTVTGQAMGDFASPRIGLNVLLGTKTYAGRTLELVPVGGGNMTEFFPRTPASWNPPRFQAFNSDQRANRPYVFGAFAATLDGREFGIEDQRQYGDSSFKAYGYLDLPFPRIARGNQASQTLTLTFPDAKPAVPQPAVVRVTLGEPKDGASIPVIHMAHEAVRTADFNAARNAKPNAAEVTWGFNPAVHLNDMDTLLENITAIGEQIAAVRAAASEAKIHIDPITFQWTHPRPAPDARATDNVGAAWCVEMLRQLALAGADEATFRLMDRPWEDSPAGDALKVWSGFAERYVLEYTTDSPGRCPVSVLAAHNTRKVRTIFLVNRTDAVQKVLFEKVDPKQASIVPIQLGKDAWKTVKQGLIQCRVGALQPKGGNVEAHLAPYAVIAFTITQSNIEP